MTTNQDNRTDGVADIGIIVFMAGVCAKNAWRTAWLNNMESKFGVDRSVFFNPVLAPEIKWDPMIHKPAEDRALQQCDYIILYLGNTFDVEGIGNTLPAYSINEAWKYMVTLRSKTIVCIDYAGLSGHPLRQLKSIAADLIEFGGPDHVFEDLERSQKFFAGEVAAIARRRVAMLTQTLKRIEEAALQE